MDSKYRNNYVIQVERTHGSEYYRIISTPEYFGELANRILKQIAQREESREDPDSGSYEQLLLSEFATIAFGRTDNVWISFRIEENLDKYHASPSKSYDWIACGELILVFVLAAMGLQTVGRWIFR